MMKKVAHLSIICLIFLVACQSSSLPANNSVIFFTFEGQDNWEIWRINRDGTSPEQIYKIPHKLDLSAAQQQKIILPEIAKTLKNNVYDPMKDDGLLGAELINISLSPNKRFLVLFEIFFRCQENSCQVEGAPIQSAIKILDLDTNTTIVTYATSDYLDTPSWSSDNNHVVFGQTPSDKSSNERETQIILLDTQSSEHTNLGYGYEPSFAKNENRIVAYKITDEHLISCCQFVSLPEKTVENVSLTQPVDNITLSPNGKTIAAVMQKEQVYYLLLIDSDISNYKMLNVPLTAKFRIRDSIKWSSNGKLLSVLNIEPPMLTVLDLAGNIRLNLENVYEWEWSNDDNEILFMRRYNNPCHQVEPYFHIITLSNKNTTKVDLPSSIKNYLSQKGFEMACHIGIGSVTW